MCSLVAKIAESVIKERGLSEDLCCCVFFIHISLLIHLFVAAIFSRPSERSTPVVAPTD